mgnify:CR=1 FL=1
MNDRINKDEIGKSGLYVKALNPLIDIEFASDVETGLSQAQKCLSSKYLYNAKGSQLFSQITKQPEYYLTAAEAEIIQNYGHLFFQNLRASPFNLFELGCGNGDKTFSLINKIQNAGQHFTFFPMDISETALDGLAQQLHKAFPLIKVKSKQGDYHNFLTSIKSLGDHVQNVVLFLGSNIGNYSNTQAHRLIGNIHKGLNSGDLLLIGMDLKKDYKRMIDAYNDKNGITEAFNLNLLHRMNEELGADFCVEAFSHYETYNPLESEMQSFLVSNKQQKVKFSKINFCAEFEEYETIFVERSHKYSFNDIEQLAKTCGFKVVDHYIDSRRDFTDSLWVRI